MNIDNTGQKELMSLVDSSDKEVVQIPHTKKSYKIGWMKGYTLERMSILELKFKASDQKPDSKKQIRAYSRFIAKAASLIILNGVKIFFLHWIFWRYLYYVKGYSFNQLEPIIEVGKKKAPAKSWLKSTILANYLKVTSMILTEDEVKQFQREQSLASKQR